MALHRLVEIRRDEREHVVVRGIRRAIRNSEVEEWQQLVFSITRIIILFSY